MAAQVEIIVKTVDQSTKQLDKIEKGFKGLQSNLKTLGKGLAVTAIAVAATFKAFERGAVVKQTAQSFDLLLKKIGAAPDLFNQLERAANGTISKIEIMSSTSLLLAGASEELGKAMADNTPMLLKIAKAANKLNPSLGTTSFLYESLGRGIKRSSPLILDNTGLVIKVGEANERFAKQLGKSVDALTAEERQMALLNETLRAGEVLIDQVGGNVDSLTDSTAKATAGFKNLKDAILADLGESTFFTTLGEDMTIVARLIEEFGTDRVFRSLFEFGKEGETRQDLIKEFNRLQAVDADNLKFQRPTFGDIPDIDFSEANIPAIPVEVKPFFEGLDTNIASQIQSAIEQINFAEIGGGELVAGFDEMFAAVAGGTLGSALGKDIFDAMFIQAQQFEVDLGNISAEEAAKNIQETLGVTFEEALALVKNIVSNITKLDGLKVRAEIQIAFSQRGPQGFTGGGTGRGRGVTSPSSSGAAGGAGAGSLSALGLADGGDVSAGSTHLVGEEGPELFTSKRSGQVVPNDAMGGNMAGVEAGLASLNTVFKDGLLDLGQKIAEVVG